MLLIFGSSDVINVLKYSSNSFNYTVNGTFEIIIIYGLFSYIAYFSLICWGKSGSYKIFDVFTFFYHSSSKSVNGSSINIIY